MVLISNNVDLFDHLRKAQECGFGTDVDLHCSDGVVSVHSAMLANVSPRLARLLQARTCCAETASISLDDVDKRSVEVIVGLLYGGKPVDLVTAACYSRVIDALQMLGIEIPEEALDLHSVSPLQISEDALQLDSDTPVVDSPMPENVDDSPVPEIVIDSVVSLADRTHDKRTSTKRKTVASVIHRAKMPKFSVLKRTPQKASRAAPSMTISYVETASMKRKSDLSVKKKTPKKASPGTLSMSTSDVKRPCSKCGEYFSIIDGSHDKHVAECGRDTKAFASSVSGKACFKPGGEYGEAFLEQQLAGFDLAEASERLRALKCFLCDQAFVHPPMVLKHVVAHFKFRLEQLLDADDVGRSQCGDCGVTRQGSTRLLHHVGSQHPQYLTQLLPEGLADVLFGLEAKQTNRQPHKDEEKLKLGRNSLSDPKSPRKRKRVRFADEVLLMKDIDKRKKEFKQSHDENNIEESEKKNKQGSTKDMKKTNSGSALDEDEADADSASFDGDSESGIDAADWSLAEEEGNSDAGASTPTRDDTAAAPQPTSLDCLLQEIRERVNKKTRARPESDSSDSEGATADAETRSGNNASSKESVLADFTTSKVLPELYVAFDESLENEAEDILDKIAELERQADRAKYTSVEDDSNGFFGFASPARSNDDEGNASADKAAKPQ